MGGKKSASVRASQSKKQKAPPKTEKKVEEKGRKKAATKTVPSKRRAVATSSPQPKKGKAQQHQSKERGKRGGGRSAQKKRLRSASVSEHDEEEKEEEEVSTAATAEVVSNSAEEEEEEEEECDNISFLKLLGANNVLLHGEEEDVVGCVGPTARHTAADDGHETFLFMNSTKEGPVRKLLQAFVKKTKGVRQPSKTKTTSMELRRKSNSIIPMSGVPFAGGMIETDQMDHAENMTEEEEAGEGAQQHSSQMPPPMSPPPRRAEEPQVMTAEGGQGDQVYDEVGGQRTAGSSAAGKRSLSRSYMAAVMKDDVLQQGEGRVSSDVHASVASATPVVQQQQKRHPETERLLKEIAHEIAIDSSATASSPSNLAIASSGALVPSLPDSQQDEEFRVEFSISHGDVCVAGLNTSESDLGIDNDFLEYEHYVFVATPNMLPRLMPDGLIVAEEVVEEAVGVEEEDEFYGYLQLKLPRDADSCALSVNTAQKCVVLEWNEPTTGDAMFQSRVFSGDLGLSSAAKLLVGVCLYNRTSKVDIL